MTRSNPTPPTGITTTFAGVTFRSRLEARWAVTFALLGWEYEYEPMVKTTNPYLPDFWIESLRAYAEIKPWRTGSNHPEWPQLRDKIVAAELDSPLMLLGATYGYAWVTHDLARHEADCLTHGIRYDTEEPKMGWHPGRIGLDQQSQMMLEPAPLLGRSTNPKVRAAWTEAGNKTRWRPRAA